MLVGLFNCKKFAWRSMQSKLSQEANKHSTYSCDPNSVWLGIYLQIEKPLLGSVLLQRTKEAATAQMGSFVSAQVMVM